MLFIFKLLRQSRPFLLSASSCLFIKWRRSRDMFTAGSLFISISRDISLPVFFKLVYKVKANSLLDMVSPWSYAGNEGPERSEPAEQFALTELKSCLTNIKVSNPPSFASHRSIHSFTRSFVHIHASVEPLSIHPLFYPWMSWPFKQSDSQSAS